MLHPAQSVMLSERPKYLVKNNSRFTLIIETRSHPEMVGDMSRVTLNFDLSKIPFVHF